jgi:hypothetical protein
VLTFGDVVIFNEVSLYMALLGYTPESIEMKNYPGILQWNINLCKNSYINDINNKMK